MFKVFITPNEVDDGQTLIVPHIIIFEGDGFIAPYNVLCDLQKALPTHCIVGIAAQAMGGSGLIVECCFNGLMSH